MTEAEAYAGFAHDLRERLHRVEAELEEQRRENAALRRRLELHVINQRRPQ